MHNINLGLEYVLNDEIAHIVFNGKKFDAAVSKSSSGAWKGLWIKAINNQVYFSFLPDDGGQIKFEFETDRWFSGKCVQ